MSDLKLVKEIFDSAQLKELIETTQRSKIVYSGKKIEKNFSDVTSYVSKIFSRPVQYYLSLKTNSNFFLLEKYISLADGVDVSSENEFDVATQKLGILPQNISVSGPGKTDRFIEKLSHVNLECFHLDSVDEFRFIQTLSNWKSPVSCRLRLQEATNSKLGMSEKEVEKIFELSEIRLKGFHIYLGREAFRPHKLEEILLRIKKLKDKFPQRFHDHFTIYLGLGLLCMDEMPDVYSDARFDVSWAHNVVVEGGRAIWSSGGIYCSQVLSKKDDLLVLQGGLQHISAPIVHTKNPNKICREFVLPELKEIKLGRQKYDIFGSWCLGYDHVALRADLPVGITRGDWICLFPMGAYNVSASSYSFIGMDLAEEYLIEKNGIVKNITPPNLKSYINSFGASDGQ